MRRIDDPALSRPARLLLLALCGVDQQRSAGHRDIDDPSLPAAARGLLLAALANYADMFGLANRTPEENLAAVIELYEAGLLSIEADDDGGGVIIGPSDLRLRGTIIDGGDLHLDN
jgi:hypothetical protein